MIVMVILWTEKYHGIIINKLIIISLCYFKVKLAYLTMTENHKLAIW